MALSIVLGSSGSGKSTYVYDKIIEESMADRNKNFLVIVPEQYTMSTQRLLVEKHPNGCIMNIDVLSFNRLAYRIFEELGVQVLDILDDVGKSLVLRKLVDDKLDELVALKKNITRISYIAQVKSLISEMTQYNITPDVLREMIAFEPMSESFRRKASDLLVMYEAFLDFTNGKYITTEAILNELNSVLADSKVVAGSTVVLDGFTGFTPIQYELVGNMLSLCDEVFVTVTGDVNESYTAQKTEDELFAMSAEFIGALRRVASYAKVEVNEPILISGENGRLSQNEVLSHLEKNLFRNTYKKYNNQNAKDFIKLSTFKNARAELEYVAIEISKLIRTGEYKYSDFAVVCPNLEQYRYHVDDAFGKYDIPRFVDAKTEILFHPFVEAISGLFEIFDTGFSKDAVFRFLRTGFTDLENEEIDYLENYVISTGIRGKKKYFHPFAIRSNTYSKPEDLLRVNELRQKFIEPFIEFDKAVTKDSTVSQIAVALYKFIISFNCEEKIAARGSFHEENKNLVRAKEYEQIYKAIMDLLDKMVAILGDEPMDLEEFSDVLEAGLASTTLGLIPPANDSVIIGDMERTRIDGIKVLFCLGASDDSIPKKIENGGILSQIEREQLLEKFEMAPSDRQRAFRQRFYLYMMLTKPELRLEICAPRVDGAGKACNVSYLYELLKEMFSIEITHYESFDIESQLLSKNSAKKLLVSLLQKSAAGGIEVLNEEEKSAFTELLAWSKENEDISFDTIMEAVFYSHKSEQVSKEIMLAVNEAFNMDETVSGSVSKFEEYADCAYKFFLRYILKLSEKEEAKLSALDIGNFNHEALEKYGKLLLDDNKKWADTTEEERSIYIDAAIAKTYESMQKVYTLEDPTQNYIVETLKETLRFTVEIITEQVKRGNFEPELFEAKVACDILDEDTEELVAKLNGKVDRVDITASDDKAVRIIDYKSSAHAIDYDECYYGLSMQLPIYMGIVLDTLGKKYPNSGLHPSAMLYYKTDKPFVNAKSSEKSLKEALLEASKMDGLVCDDRDNIEDNDKTIYTGDEKKSSIIPVTLKKDDTPDARSHCISQQGMDVLIEYSKLKASRIAKSILEGQFECSPAVLGKGKRCAFCSYNSVCHFDENVEGFKVNELEENKAEAIKLMMKELKYVGEDEVDGTN